MMNENLALKAIRTSNRNWILLGLAVLAVGVVVIALSSLPYWQKTLSPHTISNETLRKLGAETPDYGVRISGEEMIDTGYYYEYQLYGFITTSTKYYGALWIGNEGENPRFLLVEQKGNIDETITEYVGALDVMPSDVSAEIVQDIYREEPSLKGTILPVMLTTVQDEWFVGTAVIGITTAVGALVLATGILRASNISNHPVMKALSKYGDPQSVSEQIASEVNLSGSKKHKLNLTRNWAVYQSGGTFSALRLKDVVWTYWHVTQTKKYGRVTSQSFELRAFDRYGNEMHVPDSESNVKEMLQALADRAPQAFVGYDEKINAAWQKDRANLIKAMDDHYQKRKASEQ